MPHVILLHSAFTQRRIVGRTRMMREDLPLRTGDVVIAMAIAGRSTRVCPPAAAVNANGLTRRRRHRPCLSSSSASFQSATTRRSFAALLASGFCKLLDRNLRPGRSSAQGFSINRQILVQRSSPCPRPRDAIGVNASYALVMGLGRLVRHPVRVLIPPLIFLAATAA